MISLRPGYVYVMRCRKAYKIGITGRSNPARIAEVSRAMPARYHPVRQLIKVPVFEAGRKERFLLHRYADKKWIPPGAGSGKDEWRRLSVFSFIFVAAYLYFFSFIYRAIQAIVIFLIVTGLVLIIKTIAL